jgi:hypothetical protein
VLKEVLVFKRARNEIVVIFKPEPQSQNSIDNSCRFTSNTSGSIGSYEFLDKLGVIGKYCEFWVLYFGLEED